jgi:putative membrane protein
MNLQRKRNLKSTSWLFSLSLVFIAVWANSLINTTNIENWLIENALTVISLLFLISTYKIYQFNNFSYFLLCIFLCMHVYGSQYTYAESPLGFYFQDVFNSPRNQYDRLVHFSFGFLLFYPMWECFSKWLNYPKGISFFLPVVLVLAVSAIYEIIEWLVADVFFAEQGIDYLGTQGDIWDAQKDMGIAFVGVVIAALLFWVYSLSKKKPRSLLAK